MPRGWRQHDELSEALWRRMLEGPRPPSVSMASSQDRQWQRQGAECGCSSHSEPESCCSSAQSSMAWSPMPQNKIASTRVRRNPNNVEADCADQIRKLEQAIEILGRDSPQSAGLISNLKRLQVASTSPIENDWMHARDSWTSSKHAQEAVKKAVQIQSKFEASRRARQIEASAGGGSSITHEFNACRPSRRSGCIASEFR